jgi:hypothetical protein
MFCTSYSTREQQQGKDSEVRVTTMTELADKGSDVAVDVDVLTSKTPVAESGRRHFVCDDVDSRNGSGDSSCSNGSGNTSHPQDEDGFLDSDAVCRHREPRGGSGGCGCDADDADDVRDARSAVIQTCVAGCGGQKEEEIVCSICLDEFTDADPEAGTVCGHGYHLQCIMQWAQRSRECPLCFKELAMSDEDMNALLPFGEYVSPREVEAQSSMVSNMELERFLVHLAAIEQRRRDRRGGDSNRQRRGRRVDGADSSSPRRVDDCGHVVVAQHHGDAEVYQPPPREDSIVRSASQSLKSVKNKFASLFLFAGNSQ